MSRIDYKERKENRIERLENAAAKAAAESEARFNRAHELVENIPFGQPNINGCLTGVLNRSRNHMNKGFEACDKSKYYEAKAEAAKNNNAISSDDPEAVEKIKSKIAMLEASPKDKWGNNNAEIRRLKERLLQLAPEEVKAGKEITINGKPATIENMLEIFNANAPRKSIYGGAEFYLNIPFIIADEKRKYKCYISNQVNEDGTELSTYGNAENGYKPIWKPLTDSVKLNLILNQISGSGNKAVIYSILKDIINPPKPAEESAAEMAFDGGYIEISDEMNRVIIHHDSKPETEIVQALKHNGFHWSPKVGGWMRMTSQTAINAAKNICGIG